jgi:hypothetical protein
MRDVRFRAAIAALVVGLPSAGGVRAMAGCGQDGRFVGDAGPDSSMSEAEAADSTRPEGAVGQDSSPADSSATDASSSDASSDSTGPDGGTSDSGLPFDLDAGDCGTGPLGEPLDLSCTGLYADFASKTVAPGVSEYAPGLLLWSDGASKTRWIYLPPGKRIDTSDMDEWSFPVGTKVWKEFALVLGDASTETRIETRMLWKLTPTFWYRTTYKWSPDGTSSATELTTGQTDAGNGNYEIPGQYQCNSCHSGRRDGVLGFEAMSMSAPGATGMPMATLVAQGLLTDPPATPLVVPGDAVEVAALGWLHANCGTSCHNSVNGQARFTGFFLRLDVGTLASVQSTYAYTTGWNRQTSNYVIPGATTTYRLHACDTDESAAYYRAAHRDGVGGAFAGTQMPPIDSHVVDNADIAGLAAWIDEGCDAGAHDQ